MTSDTRNDVTHVYQGKDTSRCALACVESVLGGSVTKNQVKDAFDVKLLSAALNASFEKDFDAVLRLRQNLPLELEGPLMRAEEAPISKGGRGHEDSTVVGVLNHFGKKYKVKPVFESKAWRRPRSIPPELWLASDENLQLLLAQRSIASDRLRRELMREARRRWQIVCDNRRVHVGDILRIADGTHQHYVVVVDSTRDQKAPSLMDPEHTRPGTRGKNFIPVAGKAFWMVMSVLSCEKP